MAHPHPPDATNAASAANADDAPMAIRFMRQ
jgi:hypothetical protein